MLRAEIRAMECFVNAFRYRYFVYSSTNVVVADVLWYISWKMFHSSSFTVHVSLRMAKTALDCSSTKLGSFKGRCNLEKRHLYVLRYLTNPHCKRRLYSWLLQARSLPKLSFDILFDSVQRSCFVRQMKPNNWLISPFPNLRYVEGT